ncbi:helix-turn-helix domain-containing protein [Nocardioides sp. YIM 152315]|uniref:ArsR/SmtB family transcription factor n=1 Tax=Nocardioides sp. YIM 152315 TaxID=3031760 RepID=UPI0023D9ECCC|nr:helix-turn-helix domain-containing protein [Nocardioides sp. YIM 152315]MDF1605300.1 helix-turn-helix domain-containing protein [Nocardioides sp. YIM 152315]
MSDTEAPVAVGTLQEVLAALSDPVRLEMVRRMHAAAGPAPCARLYDGVSKSTASHHFKILREAGVTERSVIGGQTHQELRLDDVEERYPGVLRSILSVS